MTTTSPSLLAAFAAGLLSFLSPCVLPLVPAYLGYLSGQAVAVADERRSFVDRLATFLHALAFVVGFSAVFIALGATAGGLGRLLRSDWIRWIGGLVMVFFGLVLTGLIKLPFLYAERRVRISPRAGWGYLSSFLVGVSFAAGWTPCVGPVLGSILLLGANQETVLQSVVLLVAYSVGLGVPFLLVGLAVDRAGVLLRRLGRYLHIIQVATGVLIVVFGVLLFTDGLQALGAWMERLGIGWDLGL